jgi:hypothetical protein
MRFVSWCSFLRSVLGSDVYFMDNFLVTCVLMDSVCVCVCVCVGGGLLFLSVKYVFNLKLLK